MGDAALTKEDDKPPFAGHRVYYLILKLVVLAVAAAMAARYFSNG